MLKPKTGKYVECIVDPLDFEKNKFEEWAKNSGINLAVSHDGTYVYNPAFFSWLGWQAAVSPECSAVSEIVRRENSR